MTSEPENSSFFAPDARTDSAPPARADLLTVLAIAALAYMLANVLHEAMGHGGACLLSGCQPRLLTTVDFEGSFGSRFIDAGGTIVNLIAGGIFWGLLRAVPLRAVRLRYFFWLTMCVNLMTGTGYFFFSGVANIGDWADFIKGFSARWAWHIGLTILGAGTYFLVVLLCVRELRPFLGGEPDRSAWLRLARRLTLLPYLTGAAIYCFAGSFNPGGAYLVGISAAAASLGGTSGLAWMIASVHRRPSSEEIVLAPVRIARSWGWIAAACAVLIFFAGVLGSGIHFTTAEISPTDTRLFSASPVPRGAYLCAAHFRSLNPTLSLSRCLSPSLLTRERRA